jgi:hypothetical protein
MLLPLWALLMGTLRGLSIIETKPLRNGRT